MENWGTVNILKLLLPLGGLTYAWEMCVLVRIRLRSMSQSNGEIDTIRCCLEPEFKTKVDNLFKL